MARALELGRPHIKKNGYIYVEADRDLSQLHLPATWQQVKTTKAGTVHAGFTKVNE
jgi:16S rRNA (guanine966-N2)-methyltransferase